ncbi:hypothetical protein Golob_023875, partial [Gossypium lobatum]|nr:hypothetical protein [Gossypium lobatum]
FQWTPYEDPVIRVVIPNKFLQNPNAWHAKVVLISYATVEMHQSGRVLRQFGCRQLIPVAPEEDRYEYIPAMEPIIILELACVPEYMPWFRIHGKPYLLSVEERQRQLCVQRKRRGPLNLRRRDDDAGPSTGPKHSPGPSSAAVQSPDPTRAPTQSPDPAVQPMIPTSHPLQMMPGVFPNPYMYPNPYMFPFSSPMAGWSQWPGSTQFPVTPSRLPMYRLVVHEGSQEGSSGALLFTNPHHCMGFKHRHRW